MRYEYPGSRRQSRSPSGIPRWRRVVTLAAPVIAAFVLTGSDAAGDASSFPPSGDSSGSVQSLAKTASLDRHNPFFDPSIGTNGQACVTCHQPNQALSIRVGSID